MSRHATPNAVRFMEKVRREDECWIWTGGKSPRGYGTFWWFVGHDNHGHSTRLPNGHVEGAHRAAYRLFVGEIPDGLYVLHRCDNPPCVRPEHLFLGTNMDNVNDMIAKDRLPIGEKHWSRQRIKKLSRDDVRSILAASRHRGMGAALARQFGVTSSSILRIWTGKMWAHLVPGGV